MKHLLNIKEHGGKTVISARELHEFLEVSEKFTDWMKRMLDYGFNEHLDFIRDVGKSTGGRPSVEYALTLNCAKEISMIQRSEKGKEARQYFIDCEVRFKSAKQIVSNIQTPEQMVLQSMQYLTETVEIQKVQLLKQAPKIDYVDNVLLAENVHSITTIAKEFGMTAVKLNTLLHERGVQFKQNGVWVLYVKHQDKGYTKTKTYAFTDSYGKPQTTIQTYWTERGREFIHQLMNKQMTA